MSDPSATFGDLLLELRLGRGLSQEDLAADAKVSVRAISDLERGVTRRPHRDTVRALAGALGLPDAAAFERLARKAPPVRSSRPGRAQRVDLPAPPSSLIGREAELAALVRLVRAPAVRLVTVTGCGGVGKTRLALEVAWRVAPAYPGVHLVDLTTLSAADHVPGAVAAAMGLPRATVSSLAALVARLGADPRLLLLDSAEHVPDLAPTLADLLAGCPGLTVLATSRAPLHLRGEHLWPLAPLPLPGGDGAEPGPALRLLVDRTRAVRPGFAATPGNAADLAALCRRLDGLPLAIELAAARLRTREPGELLTELGAHRGGLTAEAVDVPDRHRSLQATVLWTVDQLAAGPRRLFAVLGCFAGGAGMPVLRRVLDATAPSTPDGAVGDLDGAVAVLTDAHLVAVVDRAGQARLTMLDTIAEVAAAVLRTADDTAVRAAHAACFLGLLRGAPGPDAVDAELENVRAAIDWARQVAPASLDAATVAAVGTYLVGRGYFSEAYRVLLALAGAVPEPLARAHALRGAGVAANEQGDPERAVALARRAVAGFDEAGDHSGRCSALALLGNASRALGDYPAARAAHEECLAVARAIGDPRALTVALNNLGTVAEDLGDYDAARAHYGESLAVKRRHGDQRGVAVAENNLGGLAAELGEYATARQHLGRAAEHFRARGEAPALSFALAMLAQAHLGDGDTEPARSCAQEALRVARGVEYGHGVGLAYARLGDVALHQGEAVAARESYDRALEQPLGLPELIRTLERLAAATVAEQPGRAARLLDEAAGLRERHGLPPSPTAGAVVERVRSALRH